MVLGTDLNSPSERMDSRRVLLPALSRPIMRIVEGEEWERNKPNQLRNLESQENRPIWRCKVVKLDLWKCKLVKLELVNHEETILRAEIISQMGDCFPLKKSLVPSSSFKKWILTHVREIIP